MATPTSKAPLNAYNTALVLLPPREFAHRINQFRLTHDKSALRWTAHITTIFPFVEEQYLPETVNMLREVVQDIQPFKLSLDTVHKFSIKDYDTVHLTVARKEDQKEAQHLWKAVSTALGYKGRPFVPHMTLGQAPNRHNTEALQFLNAKAQRILASIRDLDWTVGSIVVLKKDDQDGGIMKLYDELFLQGVTESSYQLAPRLPTINFTPVNGWTRSDVATSLASENLSSLSVATFNLLHDADFPISDRISLIVEEIAKTNADILCLQEVADDSLVLLLSSPSIGEVYRFSSRDPVVVQENERNILILSRYPFKASMVDSGTRHKPTCVAVFESAGERPLVIAAIHLTAGRAASPLEQKSKELSNVIKHLEVNHPQSDWIIAGDLNWPNEISSTPADDLFEDVGSSVGPTYDPIRNRLAASTARESKVGQRYDRILAKRNGDWKMKEVELFATAEEPASDHWGIKTVFQRNTVPALGTTSSNVADSARLPTTSISNSDLLESFRDQGWLPSTEQEDAMRRALALVRSTICAPAGHPNVVIKIEPVGSYALGLHTKNSDIDCLAVGNISPQTFWKLSQSRIRATSTQTSANGDTIKLRRFVKDAVVQMMELEVCGIKVDLQYCAAAKLVECWKDVSNLPADSSLFSLPQSSLVTLNAYRDVITIQRVVPSLEAFRTAHRALKLFLTLMGFSGARFGYLGGFHLTLLLTRVALSLPPTAQAPHLVEAFLKMYAEWDWAKDIVYPIPSKAPSVGSTQVYKRVLHREPMVVLSIERPLSNLTFHASWNSVESFSRGLRNAHESLEQGKGWADTCGIIGNPISRFIEGHKVFIKLDVSFWGGDCMKGRALIGWLESRFVNFLVQLHQAVPEVVVRMWPQRLVDESTVEADARDPNGFYLFGLTPSSSTTTSSKHSADMESSLSSCLRSFEHDLRGNENYYSDVDTFISLSHVKRTQLPTSVILDPFTWPDNGIDSPQSPDSEEEDAEEEITAEGEDVTSTGADSWDGFQVASSAQRKRVAAAAAKAKQTTHVRAGKLRTSTDVYNRLIWDTTGPVTKDSYLIGYEDRFKGIKDVPLTAWKREVEDESFIPFHRVVYFKRTTDGVHVWDRRTKVDLVFGSGVGSTSQ